MSAETLDTIKNLAEMGGTVILTVMLWFVWQRLNGVTDRLIDILNKLPDDDQDED